MQTVISLDLHLEEFCARCILKNTALSSTWFTSTGRKFETASIQDLNSTELIRSWLMDESYHSQLRWTLLIKWRECVHARLQVFHTWCGPQISKQADRILHFCRETRKCNTSFKPPNYVLAFEEYRTRPTSIYGYHSEHSRSYTKCCVGKVEISPKRWPELTFLPKLLCKFYKS